MSKVLPANCSAPCATVKFLAWLVGDTTLSFFLKEGGGWKVVVTLRRQSIRSVRENEAGCFVVLLGFGTKCLLLPAMASLLFQHQPSV